MDGPFGPATQLLGQIHYELQRLAEIADENLSAQAQLPTVVAGLLPAPVVTEAGTLDLTPLLDVVSSLRAQDNTPALAAVLVELQGLRQDFQDNLEQSRRQQAAQSMLGGPSGHVYVSDDVRIINGTSGLHVTVDSLPAGGASTDVTDRAARLLGHITVDNPSIPVTGLVSVANLPATQPVSGAVTVSNFPATQPVSLATNTPDVTDRVGRLLGHVNVDNFPATQPVSGSVSVSNFPATQPVSGTVGVSGQVDVTPSAPAANDFLPVRLTDGSAFYTASGGGAGGVAEVNSSSGVATAVGYGTTDLPMPVKTQSIGSTWVATADAVAFAANKYHFGIFNGVGSGKVIKVRKVFAVDNALAAVTGVAVRFNFERSTAQTVGTAITALAMDSTSAALPAQVAVATGPTVVDGALLWPFITTNDEAGATNAFPSNLIQQFGNLMMEGDEITELVLREGEGFAIKQITSSTVGSFSWIVVFTVE